MNKKSLILIGAGDHCKSSIDVIESEGFFDIAGIIDLPDKVGTTVFNYPIIGTDDDIPQLVKEYKNFFITIGQIKSHIKRKRLFDLLLSLDVNVPTILSSRANISNRVTIGKGTIVFPNVTIDVESKVGNNCIINHSAILLHGALLDDHCHVSVNAVVGKSKIGEGSFIGGNSWVNNGIEVAPSTIIGSCSNVVNSIHEPAVYVGNPAKPLIRKSL